MLFRSTREVIFTEDVEHIFGPRKWTSRTDELFGTPDTGKKDKESGEPVPPPIDDEDDSNITDVSSEDIDDEKK